MDATGRVHVYSGNGKGKTTASLGLAVRSRSVGGRVAMVYFDKGGEHYSERKLLEILGIDWWAFGLDRIDPTTQKFRFGVIDDDMTQAELGMQRAMELMHEEYDLCVLDEINTTVALGMLTEQHVEALLDTRPSGLELVLTGRTEVAKAASAPPGRAWPDGNERERWLSYFDRADLVSEMKLHEHYFYHGVPAREGIDY
jgi:cob(I)alamin adenosyltransferase